MPRIHKNQFKTTVGATFGIASASLTLAAGTGAALGTVSATDPVRLTLARGPLGAETQFEIVEFTGRTGDVLTGGTRGLEGTAQDQWEIGERVENRLTAAEIDEITSGAITQYFESSDIAIVDSDSGSVAHGFGVAPKQIQVVLRCNSADVGYSTGDVYTQVDVNNVKYAIFVDTGDTTNISYRSESATEGSLQIRRKDNGSLVNATAGNWRLVIRATA